MPAKISHDEFLERARSYWGDRFLYPHTKYVNYSTEIVVTCRKHGDFKARPADFLRGHSCPKCKSDKRKSLVFGVGVDDLYFESETDCGRAWRSILSRCYYKKSKARHPTYEGCSVCEDWKLYSNFKKWYTENHVEGYELEKDIIKKGNKVYCPEYCCYVPRRINTMFTKRQRFRGELPIGVTYNKRTRKYMASYHKGDRSIHLGSFETPEEAFAAYKQDKESFIKQVANEYYGRGEVTKRVYDALMRYEVEITD